MTRLVQADSKATNMQITAEYKSYMHKVDPENWSCLSLGWANSAKGILGCLTGLTG